ncbi:MAG TPA: Uma2 family endonuclease [Gemmatimonadaceae bacterium]|jgi:Uma2 family endonuclease|nr:Uma2 family endonuclease [Gemmatimonadaceae bacterium]
MPAHQPAHLVTAEELPGLELSGKSTELIRGRLIVREPPGTWHGTIAGRLAYRLGEHVYRNDLGEICGQETGFKLESGPDTVRAPDVAYVSRPRASEIPTRGYAPFAPDLAVEITSPDDRPGEVLAKVGQWLDAGTRTVWVIDPARFEARVYGHDGELTIVAADGRLDGESVLSGFSCALAEVLRRVD